MSSKICFPIIKFSTAVPDLSNSAVHTRQVNLSTTHLCGWQYWAHKSHWLQWNCWYMLKEATHLPSCLQTTLVAWTFDHLSVLKTSTILVHSEFESDQSDGTNWCVLMTLCCTSSAIDTTEPWLCCQCNYRTQKTSKLSKETNIIQNQYSIAAST